MKQAILWGAIFAVAALLIFALIAPLLFHGRNMQQLGANAFPFLLIVGGSIGIRYGIMRSRRGK